MLRLSFYSLVVLALLSACQPKPSGASKDLDRNLIPRIVAWSKEGGVFDLARTLPPGTYDRVCIIPDYNCLHNVKTLGNIDEYHSTFGMCIPENFFALVLVQGHTAHAALIEEAKLRFEIAFHGQCVPAAKAILRSNPEPGVHSQTAALGQR